MLHSRSTSRDVSFGFPFDGSAVLGKQTMCMIACTKPIDLLTSEPDVPVDKDQRAIEEDERYRQVIKQWFNTFYHAVNFNFNFKCSCENYLVVKYFLASLIQTEFVKFYTHTQFYYDGKKLTRQQVCKTKRKASLPESSKETQILSSQ